MTQQALQPRDILGEGGLNLLAEIGAIPASSLVAGQDRYFITTSLSFTPIRFSTAFTGATRGRNERGSGQ
jgi:hypothetical protein